MPHSRQLSLVAWEEVRYESSGVQASQLQGLLLPLVSVAGKNAVDLTAAKPWLTASKLLVLFRTRGIS